MVLMAGQDPALSTSHPFYDVARHGILQVAGRAPAGRSTGPWAGRPSSGQLWDKVGLAGAASLQLGKIEN